jgi:hypothetical protein
MVNWGYYAPITFSQFRVSSFLGNFTTMQATQHETKVAAIIQSAAAPPVEAQGELTIKLILSFVLPVLILASAAVAENLPEAPNQIASPMGNNFMLTSTIPAQAKTSERPTLGDKKFVSLAIISTASTFADSYTTLFARQNYLAGKKGVCNMEVESAYLYGTHPTVGRTYAVAAIKSVGSLAAAYYLHKHGHSKLWAMPLIANAAISLQGVTQNMMVCN